MLRKLLFFLSFVLLLVLVWRAAPAEFDSQLFWNSFRTAHLWWIAGSVGATFLGYVFRALRWQELLQPLKRIEFAPLMTASVVGFAAIFTLGRPGEVVRPVWISRQERVPFVGAVASIVVERVFDFLVLVLLLLVGSARIDVSAQGRIDPGALRTPWLLAGVAVLTLAAIILLHRFADPLTRLAPFELLRRLMQTFTWGLAATARPRGFAVVGLYSLLLWIVSTLQFWLMLEGLDLIYPVSAAILILVFSTLGSIVQIPGIGGGFQAGFILSATAVLGMQTEVAVAASLMVWFVMIIPTVVAAAAYMMWKGVSLRELGMRDAALSLPKR
jgi:glycosyltransferase 2 family protein